VNRAGVFEALADRPVAVFAIGPLTTTETDVAESRRQLDHALARVSEVQPVSIGIFGGVIDPGKLHFPFSSMPASDARDWDAITRWADEVADAFGGVAAVGVRNEATG
jgi:menaquinone-dependent protoporphyrinogen IX oxidase